MSNSLTKRRADAQFKKLPWIADDDNAQSEYEAAAAALAAKIARLKELRLARDAAEQAAPPIITLKKAGKKKTEKKQKKRAGISLLDWMKSRHDGVNS